MKKPPVTTQLDNENQALDQLERQIEHGNLFTHSAVSQNANRIYEVESFVFSLIDILIDNNAISQEELLLRAGQIRKEMDQQGETLGPGIALRVDGDEKKESNVVSVNCSERIPICKSICCKLQFALSTDEIESGNIKWSLGEPYYIRQDTTGVCHHADKDGKGCTIYGDRPGVCRAYSCAEDGRIWEDFDNMVLNKKWIDEHLCAATPRLVAAQMMPGPVNVVPRAVRSNKEEDEAATSDTLP